MAPTANITAAKALQNLFNPSGVIVSSPFYFVCLANLSIQRMYL